MSSFIPHRLVPGGLLQTVVGNLPSKQRVQNETITHVVHLDDGDRVTLFVDNIVQGSHTKPIVMLLHGLGGSADSGYMQRHSRRLAAAGFTVVRFNHRGCGPSMLDSSKNLYHSGRTHDLEVALTSISRMFPQRSIIAAGYSLSGNLLLKYLGAKVHPEPDKKTIQIPSSLIGALAICPPLDLESSCLALTKPNNWLLYQYYSRNVAKQARATELRRPQHERIDIPRGLDLRTLDQIYTAPRAGFANRSEYYSLCSSKESLATINLPTIILAAEDDPVVPAADFRNLSLPKSVQLRLQQGGGHMGFIGRDKTIFGDHRWLDEQVVAWARSFA